MPNFAAMYRLLRPLLFLMSPEKAHHFTASALHVVLLIPGIKSLFNRLYCHKSPKLEREVFGIRFPNPVGLAAGFDKEAKLFEDFSHLGFGFIEIGTVTPLGQEGNPKPRLFRLPADKALINRMGFNNEGLDAAVKRLKKKTSSLIIGGNIGKNKATPNENATDDYVKCFHGLYDLVDYFVVNVSSPNTPNLRELQEKEPLQKLLGSLMVENSKKKKSKPILLKIAPDLTNEQLDDIIEIVHSTGIAGIIATNTTVSRSNLTSSASELNAIGNGGLSGAPLKNRSTEVIRYLHKKSNAGFPIIGVGGISCPQDAIEKLNAGASLVQVYSGLVYYGPSLIQDINKAILKSRN
jgi:dihydroorotate dehydrogenase